MKETVHITQLKKKLLAQMNLNTQSNILMHFPFRYEQIVATSFDDWKINDKVTFEAQIVSSYRTTRFGGKRSVTHFTVLFQEREIDISIFNRPWLKYPPETIITIFGKYEGKNRVVASNVNSEPLQQQIGIHPVYHLTKGLTNKYFNDLCKNIWEVNNDKIMEFVPTKFQAKYQLISKKEAIYRCHFPMEQNEISEAIKSMKYEEFLKFQLIMQSNKSNIVDVEFGRRKEINLNKLWELKNRLQFELSLDQKKAIDEIINDLCSERIMYRLLQGDVGCGKTIVAIFAMYGCVLANYQAVIMAPTEILARQHYESIKQLLPEVKVGFLAGNLVDNQEITDIKKGTTQIVVGTHKVFQNDVSFANLGLVVTDEQQRFGVMQRSKLNKKGEKVDVLMMSATPIPRTLATGLFGNMDVSTIEQLPIGKKKIITKLVKENSLRSIMDFLEKELDSANQIYLVCPSVEHNDEYRMRDVESLKVNLQKHWGSKYLVCAIHGQMKSEEKERIMNDFMQHKFSVLVTTTVVEVGVNNKNANIMVIYNAERFGLSQLHQLRGRVGRGKEQGYCFLLSDSQDEQTLKRLDTLVKYQDGFKISMVDLQLRGPGDLLGIRQSGIPDFAFGDLVDDEKILLQTKDDATEILNNLDAYPLIKEYLYQWQNSKDVSME